MLEGEYRQHQRPPRRPPSRSASPNPQPEDDTQLLTQALDQAHEDMFVTILSDGRVSTLQNPTSMPSSAIDTQSIVDSSVTIEERFSQLSTADLSNDSDRRADHDGKQSSGVSTLLQRRRERKKDTTRDLKILDNAQAMILDCVATLSQTPTPRILKDVQSTLRVCRLLVIGIKGGVASIDARKAEILKSLDNLETRWLELSNLFSRDDPLQYSTGNPISPPYRLLF